MKGVALLATDLPTGLLEAGEVTAAAGRGALATPAVVESVIHAATIGFASLVAPANSVNGPPTCASAPRSTSSHPTIPMNEVGRRPGYRQTGVTWRDLPPFT
ncbi:hypothetical protein [Streptomyces sp. NPDC056464]|uniref:hypothetical protein n=1 Tax=Streptomyces sp. NPDC056464 TaxID=3345828 RepID=UPI0036855985